VQTICRPSIFKVLSYMLWGITIALTIHTSIVLYNVKFNNYTLLSKATTYQQI